MACARVPLDEQQVTEPGPSGQEHTLPALVRARTGPFHPDICTLSIALAQVTFVDNNPCTVC